MKKLFLLLAISTLLFCSSSAQKLDLSLGTGKTELKQNAINIGISYAKTLDSIWQNQDYLIAGNHSFFLITPSFNIQSGTQDAFSSIQAKVIGLIMKFKDTTISGIVTPNTARTFHTYPISFGVETNNQFSRINGIFEAGWVPWVKSGFFKAAKIGVFLQAGYKFAGADAPVVIGGAVDESAEPVQNSILRAKASLLLNTDAFITLGGFRLGIVGAGDVWQDLLHSRTYYKVDGRARVFLMADRYVDFVYQKGSGAPNFNEGDQWGIALTVSF